MHSSKYPLGAWSRLSVKRLMDPRIAWIVGAKRQVAESPLSLDISITPEFAFNCAVLLTLAERREPATRSRPPPLPNRLVKRGSSRYARMKNFYKFPA